MQQNSKFSIVTMLIIVLIGLILANFYYKNNLAGRNNHKVYSREEIEQIVKEFIQGNPEVILASLEEMQLKNNQKQSEGLKQNLNMAANMLFESKASPIVGPSDADVNIVMFFDYFCSFCRRTTTILDKIVTEDKKVRVIFKEWAMLSDNSKIAARYSIASYLLYPEKYFEVHQAFMTSQLLDEKNIKELLKNKGLDAEEIQKKAYSSEVTNEISQVSNLAKTLNIRGTPSFVIGENIAPGAISYEDLKAMIKSVRESSKVQK